ncbi:hypothetical protein [Pseudoglutamicibacter cumminsii]|uniref:hypothetical protein n=1 Tax=Pseudoglutamicibacter cumminsii TaxID=156979 RepID=UPI001956B27C|nr:hypothetical protein [Pseudoglutamicibacter cumminsii]MBM7796147.1 hypothetical protein [Pseudoglutamicibacter cumminsii]
MKGQVSARRYSGDYAASKGSASVPADSAVAGSGAVASESAAAAPADLVAAAAPAVVEASSADFGSAPVAAHRYCFGNSWPSQH